MAGQSALGVLDRAGHVAARGPPTNAAFLAGVLQHDSYSGDYEVIWRGLLIGPYLIAQ